MTARCPQGLGAAGRRLWRDVATAWDLQAPDLILLEQACCAADRCAQLRAECRQAPAVIVGRLGQSLPNPLLSELRAERRSLVLLLHALGLLSDAAEDDGGALAPVVALRALG